MNEKFKSTRELDENEASKMAEEESIKIMCTEVFEMLRHCKREDIEKVPKNLIEAIKYNKLDNYKVDIDLNKMLNEQKVSEDAKNIMFIIWRKYWATEEETKEFDKILDENQKAFEEKYKFDWNKVNKEKAEHENAKIEDTKETEQHQKENPENPNTQLVEYKEDKWYNKVFSFIKKIFRK